MTRSPANTSGNGASPDLPALRSLLQRVDALADPVLTHDEVCRWPAGVRDWLVERGWLRAISDSDTVPCDGCAAGHLLTVEVREYPAGLRAVAHCPECGRVDVPLKRLRQWGVDFASVAEAMGRAARAVGGVTVEVPNRLAFLGVVRHENQARDLFAARGLAWPDAGDVLDASPRLRASTKPAVLPLAILPDDSRRLPVRPAAVTIAEALGFRRGKLTIDLGPLLAHEPAPHPAASTPKWLTVTEAAKLLREDVDGWTLAKGKARVASAAKRRKFKTNGKTWRQRRIERDSFSAWRLDLREKELDRDH